MAIDFKQKTKTSHLLQRFFLAQLGLLLLFAFTACDKDIPEPKDGNGEVTLVQDIPAPNCVGKVIVEKDAEGAIKIGGLTCAGECPNEVKCRPVKNQAQDKEWCGCPGDVAPPEGCSTLKVKGSDGKWRISCGGICPVPTDICKPVRQVLVPGKKWAISCECFSITEASRMQGPGQSGEEQMEELQGE